MNRKIKYLKKYKLSNLLKTYKIRKNIVHDSNGRYIDVCVLTKENDVILSHLDDEYLTIDRILKENNSYYLYELPLGIFVLSSNTNNYIPLDEKSINVETTSAILSKPFADKFKSVSKDSFLVDLLNQSLRPLFEYRKELESKQLNELEEYFTCTVCKNKYKNLNKHLIWCSTPYGKNHESYKVITCRDCYEKSKLNDGKKNLIETILRIILYLAVTVTSFYLMFFSYDNTFIISSIVSVVCFFIFYIITEESFDAEILLKKLGLIVFVEKSKAKQLKGLVSDIEMYGRKSDEAEHNIYKQSMCLSDEVTHLLHQVCPHYGSYSIIEYYFGRDMIDDQSISWKVKNKILHFASDMAEKKRSEYTSVLYVAIKEISEKTKLKFGTALSSYVMIIDFILEELVQTYRFHSSHSAVFNRIPYFEDRILSENLTSISTNLSINHNIAYSITYFIDTTREYDSVLESSRAIYQIVNNYGTPSHILDKEKMREIITKVIEKINSNKS